MRAARPGRLLLLCALATTGGSGNALAASGLFQPCTSRPTGSRADAVAIADLNDDGRNDVAVVTSFYFDPVNDHKLHVFLQDAFGNLQAPVKYSLGNWPHSLDVGDLNGDGRMDVVVANSSSGSIGVLVQNASGTLEPMVPYATTHTHLVRVGDFNHDGRADVASIAGSGTSAHVFLQNASGTLQPPAAHPVTYSGSSDLDAGDVNADGRDDIIVMSGQASQAVGVLLQQAGGGFSAATYYGVTTLSSANGVAVGDVNDDGRQDVVLSYGGNSPNSFIGVFLQNAAGTLDAAVKRVSYDIPEPVEVADVNSDGRGDILTLHSGWSRMGIYLQNATGGLAAEVLEPVPNDSYWPQALAVGDINGDGLPDAVIADFDDGLVVLYHRKVHALSVAITDWPDPGAVRTNVIYTIPVSNAGSSPMTGVTLTHTLPRAMTFVWSTPDSGTCTRDGRTLTCPLGTLAPGQTVEVIVVGLVEAQRRPSREHVSTVTVTANEPDDPADNTARVTTRVIVPCTYPLLDGGFELGTPNPRWDERSTNFGTPLCTVGTCGTGGATAVPRRGTWWAWFGGVAAETSSLTQPVTLPAGAAWLRFWLWNGASSGNGTDNLRVLVDGVPLFTAVEGAPAYTAGYTPVQVDLTPFADGGAHALQFEFASSGPRITSFSVDDVLLESSVFPPRPRQYFFCF